MSDAFSLNLNGFVSPIFFRTGFPFGSLRPLFFGSFWPRGAERVPLGTRTGQPLSQAEDGDSASRIIQLTDRLRTAVGNLHDPIRPCAHPPRRFAPGRRGWRCEASRPAQPNFSAQHSAGISLWRRPPPHRLAPVPLGTRRLDLTRPSGTPAGTAARRFFRGVAMPATWASVIAFSPDRPAKRPVGALRCLQEEGEGAARHTKTPAGRRQRKELRALSSSSRRVGWRRLARSSIAVIQ